jgi:glycosyltransferase involved in cell wall biosynthesis
VRAESGPIASVVIPTYNRADLVLRAVASVQRQSFGDWELLVVDDASTDDTKRRVEQLRDPRIEYVRRHLNGGVAAAQNTGLDRAVGRYVLFLHSDDELLPECLQRLSDILASAPPAIGGAAAGLEVVEPKGIARRGPYLEGADDRALLSYRSGVHVSTLLLRRELAAAVRFDESLRGVEDRDFCIRLLRRTRLAFERDPLVRIDRTARRLTAHSKGPTYEYLLRKYHDEIVSSPEIHGSWWFRIAREYARVGELHRARGAIQRAVRVDPTRIRRWPLFAASYGSDGIFSNALRVYGSAATVLSPRETG